MADFRKRPINTLCQSYILMQTQKTLLLDFRVKFMTGYSIDKIEVMSNNEET